MNKIADKQIYSKAQKYIKVLDNIKLELPEVPDINDIKIIKLNREKVENDIIKPKDKLIDKLYQDNKNLYRELSKQVNLVDKEPKYSPVFFKTILLPLIVKLLIISAFPLF